MPGAVFRRDRSNLNIECITQPPRKFYGPTLLPETDEQKLRVLASRMIANNVTLKFLERSAFKRF